MKKPEISSMKEKEKGLAALSNVKMHLSAKYGLSSPFEKQGYFSLLEGAKGETACLPEGSLHFELSTRHDYVLFSKADLQNKINVLLQPCI